MSDEGTRYLPPLGRHEMDAIVVATPDERKLLERQLKAKGLDTTIFPISPGMCLAGRRFRLIYMPNSIAGRIHAREVPRFSQWVEDTLRCRLTREGAIIYLPS
jgi:hypothetical protein